MNISCSEIFDSCKIKRMVNNLTQLGYVNNYDKNRYLEKFLKAAVHNCMGRKLLTTDLIRRFTDGIIDKNLG